MVFEMVLEPLVGSTSVRYQKISKYPQIRRDLSLVVDQAISSAQVEFFTRRAVGFNLLKSFDVFDVYQGEHIPQGKKSLAISLTLQSDSRTLTDGEISAIMETVLESLKRELAIQLRD
jgi:phenylalanyl-tRNA synthetase beta chain